MNEPLPPWRWCRCFGQRKKAIAISSITTTNSKLWRRTSLSTPDPKFLIRWLDAGREPIAAPNPAYPAGIDLDVTDGRTPACTVILPYPAKRCGHYEIFCSQCQFAAAITTAGRPDDPRSVKIPCASKSERALVDDPREMGRQLRADELKVKAVVVVRRADREIAATLWVQAVNENSVVFLAGATWPRVHFMATRHEDGTLTDDTGKQVLVYEYLGEI
jgi:hypothetical protein